MSNTVAGILRSAAVNNKQKQINEHEVLGTQPGYQYVAIKSPPMVPMYQ